MNWSESAGIESAARIERGFKRDKYSGPRDGERSIHDARGLRVAAFEVRNDFVTANRLNESRIKTGSNRPWS